MRRFSSYGPIDKDLHYYVPRQALVDRACSQLLGEDHTKGGHYMTLWAPRQRGKTWLMQQVAGHIAARGDLEVAILTMQSAKEAETAEQVFRILVNGLRKWFKRDLPDVAAWDELAALFAAPHFTRPVILILDEFDALGETFINHRRAPRRQKSAAAVRGVSAREPGVADGHVMRTMGKEKER